MTTTDAQRTQMETGQGFVAALDQSGGSTPKALSLYGVEPSDYSGDAEMFQAMHDMRARIILADDFTSDKFLGAILFERTMDNTINGKPVAQLLWEDRGVVPFLKIDKGLEDEANGVQLLKPMPELDDLLKQCRRDRVGRGAAIRRRQNCLRCRSGPDHRARGEYPFREQGGSRRHPEIRAREALGHAVGGGTGDAQGDAARSCGAL